MSKKISEVQFLQVTVIPLVFLWVNIIKMKIQAMLLYTVITLVGYLTLSLLIHHYVVPMKKIAYNTYFKPGDTFNSITEGFNQTVLSQDGEWLNVHLEIQPHAPGPPEHVHNDFDETFIVKQGVLSILVNGEVKTVKAGESYHIPKGTPHKPFSESDQIVIVEAKDNSKNLPAKFAYFLKQFYPFVDSMGQNPNSFKILMQMSVYGNDMDTWIVGPPIAAQKILRFILAPTARLFGYKNYYEPKANS
jgi:mannose-6-phosphate isomerase-like protein (cupin superfamily)